MRIAWSWDKFQTFQSRAFRNNNKNAEHHLSGTKMRKSRSRIFSRLLKHLTWERCGVLTVIPIVSGLVISMRLAGWLQLLEWAALDTFFQLRPLEPPDEKIVIIGIQESDIQKLKQWPISDQILANLLNKIKQQKPRAIGLDIYRDLPVNPGYEELIKVFRSTANLVGVQKVIGDEFNARGEVLSSKIAPPPELERLGQISASATPVDGDGVVRRGMLFPMPEGNEAIPSLGLAVAGVYLQKQGITPTTANNGLMKLGQTVFTRFNTNDGGYVRADAGSYQTLLNFRGPSQSFPQVSLTSVLENRISPDLLRDRIVLIGSVAASINDFFYTPYSGGLFSNNRGVIASPVRTPGVEVHANLASQILGSVLDNRPLLRIWSEPEERLWIINLVTLPVILGWWLQNNNGTKNFIIKVLLSMIIGVSTIIVILLLASYQAFLMNLWISIIPSLLGLCSSAFTVFGYVYINQTQKDNIKLKLMLQEVKQKLEQKNEQLEHISQKSRLQNEFITDKFTFNEIQNQADLDEKIIEKVNHILFGSLENE